VSLGEVLMNAWTSRRIAAPTLAGALGLAAWLGAGGSVRAAAPAPDPNRTAEGRQLPTIVVTAQRLADEQLRMQVESALRNHPTLMSDHLAVSIKDGVVTLKGMVFDEWDMRIARRAAKRIPGVKRLVNDMEIEQGGD
jgi:osmotically-inducible protein OsmY